MDRTPGNMNNLGRRMEEQRCCNKMAANGKTGRLYKDVCVGRAIR